MIFELPVDLINSGNNATQVGDTRLPRLTPFCSYVLALSVSFFSEIVLLFPSRGGSKYVVSRNDENMRILQGVRSSSTSLSRLCESYREHGVFSSRMIIIDRCTEFDIVRCMPPRFFRRCSGNEQIERFASRWNGKRNNILGNFVK